FAESDRILYFSSQNIRNPRGFGGTSHPDYDDLKSQVKSFNGLGAASRDRVNLSDDASTPESYTSAPITANAFAVLGQQPVIGRAFTPEDAKPGAEPVTILPYALGEGRYGKEPSIIGKKIRINPTSYTVIGVMPRGLAMPAEMNLWTPLIPTGKE